MDEPLPQTNFQIPPPKKPNITYHKPTNKFIVFIILLILLLLAGISKYYGLLEIPVALPIIDFKLSNLLKNKNPAVTTSPAISKYNIDTDKDSIPDFVESAIGYDPNQDECLLSLCGTKNIAPEPSVAVNILIILDSSGSMAQFAGSKQKMATAKEALNNYVSFLGEKTNVGLMVYGNKGSNNTSDKQLSCGSIDLVYPLQKVDKIAFAKAVDTFQPTGWTPIGDSLKKAKEAFSGKSGQKNFVLLISDGIETCGSDPSEAAKELISSNINPQIDVIGFNVDTAAKNQLEEITRISGGTFYDAQTSEEFTKEIENWNEKIKNNISLLGCRIRAGEDFMKCISNRMNNANDYLTKISLSLYTNKSYGGIKSSGEDSVEKINNTQKEIQNYFENANNINNKNIEDAWKNWQQNNPKLNSYP